MRSQGRQIRVLQIGLGSLGKGLLARACEREGLQVVGVVDAAPGAIGRSAGELCGIGRKCFLRVIGDIAEGVRRAGPQVAVLSTVSSLEALVPQARILLEAGIPVVSTCEELSYPWRTQPKAAALLDRLAKKGGVAILGTGVNPGFLMDFLPAALTGICGRVESVRVSRIQNAATRREAFRKKIGVGLSRAEFARRVREGSIRHVGLTESMHMVAAALGWNVTRTEDIIRPVIAKKRVSLPSGVLQAGLAAGVEQTGRAYLRGKPVITLVFRASVQEEETRDSVEVTGEPSFSAVIPGGINGDVATCAITLNAVPAVLKARLGLRTMLDIAPVTWLR